jgi:hypothetical protein
MRGEKASLADELLYCIQDWSLQKGIRNDELNYELESELREAVKLVEGMHTTMNPFFRLGDNKTALEDDRSTLNKFEKDEDQTAWVWRSRNLRKAMLGGENDDQYWRCNLSEVSSYASDYLSKPWATCAPLEKVLLDCLVYQYGLDIAEHSQYFLRDSVVHSDAGRWLTKHCLSRVTANKPVSVAVRAIVGLILSIPVGFGAWHAVGWWAGVFVFDVLICAFGVSSYLSMKMNTQEGKAPSLDLVIKGVIEEVSSAYELIQRPAISPRYLRERFAHLAANEGIDWPAGVLEIIEHAERRNPERWE